MRDLSDTEISRLGELLDEWCDAAPELAPLDVSALDGYLCGVLLQPGPVAEAEWVPCVLDAEGRPARVAATMVPAGLLPLVRQRHAALAQAIAQRQWFDPWIVDAATLDEPAGGSQGDESELAAIRASVLPWVAGFALATERFPSLLRHDAQVLAEPLALLYQHFEPDELEGVEDEPALAEALAASEPPADLAEAAEDLVRAVLLLADISRPRPNSPPAPRTAPARASLTPAPRSKNARPARVRRG